MDFDAKSEHNMFVFISDFNWKCKRILFPHEPTLYGVRPWKFFILTVIDSKIVCKISVKSINLICGFNQKRKQMILSQEPALYEVRPWNFFIVTVINSKLVCKIDSFDMRLQSKMQTNDFVPETYSLWVMAMKILYC